MVVGKRRDGQAARRGRPGKRAWSRACQPGTPAPEGAMLHVTDLTYRIGERVLFDRASFAIPDGGRVGLVGRNGSGKTTLFRIVQGEIAPGSGATTPPRGGQRRAGIRRDPPAARGAHRRGR